jgi:transcriptional regulator with XRE-family HTH domain
MEPRITLGQVVGSRRREFGLSLGQLAQLVDLNKTTVMRLENGAIAAPSPATLAQLARTLDLPAADLFALAGYTVPRDLPGLRGYLHVLFGELPEGVVEEIEGYLEIVVGRHQTSMTASLVRSK